MESGGCKRCGSEASVKSGRVRGLQRYRCKACGYHFTATPPYTIAPHSAQAYLPHCLRHHQSGFLGVDHRRTCLRRTSTITSMPSAILLAVFPAPPAFRRPASPAAPHVVFDQQNGDATRLEFARSSRLAPRFPVHSSRRRFVQNQQTRLGRQGPSDFQPPLVAVGQVLRHRQGLLAQADEFQFLQARSTGAAFPRAAGIGNRNMAARIPPRIR
jgi:hypothetical protein